MNEKSGKPNIDTFVTYDSKDSKDLMLSVPFFRLQFCPSDGCNCCCGTGKRLFDIAVSQHRMRFIVRLKLIELDDQQQQPYATQGNKNLLRASVTALQMEHVAHHVPGY